MGYTTISVKKQTKIRLETFSKGKESWDELLNRLMDQLHKQLETR